MSGTGADTRAGRTETRGIPDAAGSFKDVPGQCVYAPLIDEQAGIINDPIILCLAPDRYWLSISDSDVLLWVKGLAIGAGFDVEVTDPDVFPLSLQGPKSETLLSHLVKEPLSEVRFRL